MIKFLRELPHIYILLMLLLILIGFYYGTGAEFLKDSIIGVIGAIIALSTRMNQSNPAITTDTITVDNVNTGEGTKAPPKAPEDLPTFNTGGR